MSPCFGQSNFIGKFLSIVNLGRVTYSLIAPFFISFFVGKFTFTVNFVIRVICSSKKGGIANEFRYLENNSNLITRQPQSTGSAPSYCVPGILITCYPRAYLRRTSHSSARIPASNPGQPAMLPRAGSPAADCGERAGCDRSRARPPSDPLHPCGMR